MFEISRGCVDVCMDEGYAAHECGPQVGGKEMDSVCGEGGEQWAGGEVRVPETVAMVVPVVAMVMVVADEAKATLRMKWDHKVGAGAGPGGAMAGSAAQDDTREPDCWRHASCIHAALY